MVLDNPAWIGLTDEVVEGEWRKPGSSASDEEFDTRMNGNLFSWVPPEPNNGRVNRITAVYQDCVYVGYKGPLNMDDTNCCTDVPVGTCTSFYSGDKFGLCEIKLLEG